MDGPGDSVMFFFRVPFVCCCSKQAEKNYFQFDVIKKVYKTYFLPPHNSARKTVCIQTKKPFFFLHFIA